MSYTQLTAPFSGRILNIDVAVGDRISSVAALLMLGDFASLQSEFLFLFLCIRHSVCVSHWTSGSLAPRMQQMPLSALEVQHVGDYEDHLGQYQLLVRSPKLRAGDQIMVSQLPTAVTGLLVAPVESGAPAATELAAQWSSIN